MFSRDEILEKLKAQVSEKRFKHCLGVEKAAGELAERYGADVATARLAGLLHDYAKELPDSDFLALIDQYKLDPDLKNWGNNVWHGMVGWLKVRADFPGIAPEILRAIESHTVGSGEMTTLDKIVYVADYIEAGRDFEGVEEAREIAERSLDAAVAYETARTVEFLAQKYIKIYPQTIETYNAYIEFLEG